MLGAPSYFAARGRPKAPEDLAGHECIRFRLPGTGRVYRWEFSRDGQALTIDPPGSILVDDSTLLRALAVKGMGLVYTSSLQAAAEISAGLLEPVLEPFAPEEEAALAEALLRAAEAVVCFVAEGVAPAMNRFNGPIDGSLSGH